MLKCIDEWQLGDDNMVDGITMGIILSGFVPTWIAMAKIYYDIGRTRQCIEDLKKIVINGFGKKSRR